MTAETDFSDPKTCKECWLHQNGLCAMLADSAGAGEMERSRLQREAPAGQVLQHAGAQVDQVSVIHTGWAVSFHLLADGRRQILSLLLPGDLLSSMTLFAEEVPFSVVALTPVRLCKLPRTLVTRFLPTMVEPAGRMLAQELRALHLRVVDLGRRSAEQRMASFLLDLRERLVRIGEERDGWMPFLIRQYDLADALGMTPVHVSRILARFRREGWVELEARSVRVLDLDALVQLADRWLRN